MLADRSAFRVRQCVATPPPVMVSRSACTVSVVALSPFSAPGPISGRGWASASSANCASERGVASSPGSLTVRPLNRWGRISLAEQADAAVSVQRGRDARHAELPVIIPPDDAPSSWRWGDREAAELAVLQSAHFPCDHCGARDRGCREPAPCPDWPSCPPPHLTRSDTAVLSRPAAGTVARASLLVIAIPNSFRYVAPGFRRSRLKRRAPPRTNFRPHSSDQVWCETHVRWNFCWLHRDL